MRQEGRAGPVGKAGKARRLPPFLGKHFRGKEGLQGRTLGEALHPGQEPGNERCSTQVRLVRGSPQRRGSLQVPVGTQDSEFAMRPDRERKPNQNGQTTGNTRRYGTN